jgi:hypothetical protein
LTRRTTHRQIVLAVLSALLLSACSDPTPLIGQGLPKSFGPTPEFDRRIRQRFPIGSDEAVLLAELRSERFAIKETHDLSSRYRFTALYEAHEVVCKESWTVQWTAEQGRISNIAGEYSGEICL